MRRKWVAKAAAVCLSAAMTATPAVQSFAAEEATSAIQTEMLEQDLQKEQTEEDDISVMAEAVESEARVFQKQKNQQRRQSLRMCKKHKLQKPQR